MGKMVGADWYAVTGLVEHLSAIQEFVATVEQIHREDAAGPVVAPVFDGITASIVLG